MKQKMIPVLNHSIKVDDDVWLELIKRKYSGRFHNCNDPLRILLGLDPSQNDPVKIYSDEMILSDEGGPARAPAETETRSREQCPADQ